MLNQQIYSYEIDKKYEKMMEFAKGTIERYRTNVSNPAYPSNACDVFYIRGDENGTKLFEFLADHVSALSHVELSLISTGSDGNKGLNFLTTSHTKSSDYGQGIMWVSQLYTYSIRDMIHTHPTNPDSSQSDEESASAISSYLHNQNKTAPSFYIYHVPTKKYIPYGK